MNLINYLPLFYKNSPEMLNIQNSINIVGIDLENTMLDLRNQYFIDTATWGLTNWEKLFNLHTDLAQSYEVRRSRIKTYLRNQGTCTILKLKNICKSYVNGEVDIMEDCGNYKLTVKFVGENGVPANMQYLQQVLRKTIPSHLQFLFAYSYLMLTDVEEMTLNELEQTSLASFGM